ncbi:MAG: RNA 2',3'-cyclic phosphodiesterase [Eubacteriales bacterium]|nr:RNA 2',3'-cyclic phosphodiesterase [Eubacteriales bacterium]
MRLFIAIHLSSKIIEALEDAQDTLFRQGVTGNYTPAENMHITLAFIGEYPDPEAVLDALDSVDYTPFPIRLGGFGNFGDLWWAGIQKSDELTVLAKKVRRALAAAGIPYDRKRFSPHITLIRRAHIKRMPGIAMPDITMCVDHISLMRSDRGKNGMIYTELGRL